MDLSIVIVNWNTSQVTCECLESVYAQTEGLEYEVLVVDNASSDDSVVRIESEFPQVHLIRNNVNRGFAKANNQALRVARGNYLLLLNSDTVVLEEAIPKTMAFAEKQGDAGVVTCRVLNPDRSLQPTCFRFPSFLNLILGASGLYKMFPKNRFFGREFLGWWDRDEAREVDVATGCFMLVRKQAICLVGLLDEDYFIYGEETDWCWRFKKNGWRVLFSPEGEIIHLGGQSTSRVKPEMMLQLRSSILLFIKKNKGSIEYVLSCLAVSTWFLLRMPIWLGKAAWHRDRKTWRLFIAYLKGIPLSLLGWRALRVQPRD